MRVLLSVTLSLGVGFLAGCGGGEEYAYEIENPDSPEVVYAKEVYSLLQEMKKSNQVEGPQSIDFVGYIEGMEGYEEPPVGEHAATYEEIHAGVKELQQQVQSGASKAEVDEKLDELLEKAKSLPHGMGGEGNGDGEGGA